MRVLVVGSLPPPDSVRAGALRDEVVRLLAEGHTVEVVAPDPVATAHRYMSARGIPACVRLWTMVSAFDSVVVQLQPGLPVRERAGRLERELSLMALSLVLRRARHVVVRLESLDDLPGGATGRGALLLWRSADRIVVGSDSERAALVAAGAPLESAVTGSRPEHGAPTAVADDGGWGEGSEVSAEDVLELVRMRAARERQELAGESSHLPGWERLPATGIALAELDLAQPRPEERPRTPADVARSVLAVADRRPALRPVVRALRVGYRSARDLLGRA
jgi:hypothetical protein